MALSASTIWEVETTGSDTLNGGAFDPSQTAGMFTDGAATSANTSSPVFTSASYNFAAGDVGAWVYISSGTNWTPGWYKIASVASNAATLTGTIGQAVLKTTLVPSTVVGCATTASPTGATWTIDYSQQAAARYAYTDLASAGTGLTVSSAAKPFAKEQVGNSIVITGGTNFNTGRYVIASVAAGVATVVGPTNITTGAGASGTGGQGGALASPAVPSGIKVASNTVFVAAGTYSITTASTNVANGCISDAAGGNVSGARVWEGYSAIRGDMGTMPLLQASGISGATLFTITSGSTAGGYIRNLKIDGAGLGTMTGVSVARRDFQLDRVHVVNCTTLGINGAAIIGISRSLVKTCGTGIAFSGAGSWLIASEVTACTVLGVDALNAVAIVNSLIYSNTGSTTDGIRLGGGSTFIFSNLVLYANGRDGIRSNAGGLINVVCMNVIVESNGGTGFNPSPAPSGIFNAITCAAYSGTPVAGNVVGALIALSASPFTNAAAGDFSLNNTAGGGALCRAAGFPGAFPAGTSIGYLDIGAVQHSGGGGGLFGMTGVM